MLTKNHTIKKVAVLSRRSRPEETEGTIKRQLQSCIDICNANGWEYDVYSEVASSQVIDVLNRPIFNDMLKRIAMFEYDAVVAVDLDRLGRNHKVVSEVKQVLIDSGTLFVTPNKTYDFSLPEDDFTSDLLTTLARAEYVKANARLIRGTRNSVKEGKWMGSPPYGYTKDYQTKRLVPKKDEAIIVQHIFELYVIHGMSSYYISKETGINYRSVRRILRNRAYIGAATYGKTKKVKGKRIHTPPNEWIVTYNAHEPIVDVSLYYEAQQMLDKEDESRPPTRIRTHRYSCLFKCKFCGATLYMTNRKSGEFIRACKDCGNGGIKVDLIEPFITSHLKAEIASLSSFISEGLNTLGDKENLLEANLKAYKGILEGLKRKISATQDGYLDGIYTKEESKEKIEQLRKEIVITENKMEMEKNKLNLSEVERAERLKAKLTSFLEDRDSYSDTEYNCILRTIIDKIEYSRNVDVISLTIVYKE